MVDKERIVKQVLIRTRGNCFPWYNKDYGNSLGSFLIKTSKKELCKEEKLKRLSREYEYAIEDNKRRLREEIEKKNIFKSVAEYKSSNHHGRANPIEIINKAFNTKSHIAHNNININNNSNRLLNLLREANITKEDIVTIYGNPYLTTISNWNNISTRDKDNIRKEYPEMDNLAKAYEERKKDWGDTVIKVLKGTTEVLDTIKKVLDNPIIDWCIVATAVATSITCPPLGGVAVPACTAVLTRKAVAKLAPTAGLLLTREIGREIGKDATELQREFDILYNKKHNNNGNKNNKNSSQPQNNNSNQRLVLEYGKGSFWEALITKSQEARLIAISRKAKADIRMDKNGFYYKFDPAHKVFKVHLHKYKHLGGNKFQLIEEVNPVTGQGKLVFGGVEIW